MASNQEFWVTKLKSWLQACYYNTDEEVTDALLQGIAAALNQIECAADDHQRETFICLAEGGYLDEHGLERNLTRNPGEIDSAYCLRIREIVNASSCPSIKTLVDAILQVGESTIIEDHLAASFFSREAFFNRGNLLLTQIKNTFSILVDKQVHEPYSFYGREYFADREDFVGTNESSVELFNNIITAVNQAKAFGVLYRVIERLE